MDKVSEPDDEMVYCIYTFHFSSNNQKFLVNDPGYCSTSVNLIVYIYNVYICRNYKLHFVKINNMYLFTCIKKHKYLME